MLELDNMANMVLLPFFKSAAVIMSKRAIVGMLNSDNFAEFSLGDISAATISQGTINVGRRGTNQLRLLERYLDVLVKHTTEIPPLTALVEGTAPSALVEGVSLR